MAFIIAIPAVPYRPISFLEENSQAEVRRNSAFKRETPGESPDRHRVWRSLIYKGTPSFFDVPIRRRRRRRIKRRGKKRSRLFSLSKSCLPLHVFARASCREVASRTYTLRVWISDHLTKMIIRLGCRRSRSFFMPLRSALPAGRYKGIACERAVCIGRSKLGISALVNRVFQERLSRASLLRYIRRAGKSDSFERRFRFTGHSHIRRTEINDRR